MQLKAHELESDEKGFELLSKSLYELTGIHLPKNQKNLSLMSGRMSKVLNKMHISSYLEFHKLLKSKDPKATQQFIEALTTHTTHFFREPVHYKALADLILQEFRGHTEVRIWCGACSTGEEAYSLAITLLELNMPTLRFKILATDIDQKVVDVANHGVYHAKNLSNVSPLLLNKYFVRGKGSQEHLLRVKGHVKENISFTTFNLIQDSYSFRQNFHIIFLRNVLIYFDKPTIASIITHMAHALDTKGYLFVGLSEAGVDPQTYFNKVSPGILRRIAHKQEVAS